MSPQEVKALTIDWLCRQLTDNSEVLYEYKPIVELIGKETAPKVFESHGYAYQAVRGTKDDSVTHKCLLISDVGGVRNSTMLASDDPAALFVMAQYISQLGTPPNQKKILELQKEYIEEQMKKREQFIEESFSEHDWAELTPKIIGEDPATEPLAEESHEPMMPKDVVVAFVKYDKGGQFIPFTIGMSMKGVTTIYNKHMESLAINEALIEESESVATDFLSYYNTHL